MHFWKEAVARGVLVLALTIGLVSSVSSQTTFDVMNGSAPYWVLKGTVPATLNYNFAQGLYYQAGRQTGMSAANVLTVSRPAPSVTDLLPTSPSGYAYQTFVANTARVTSGVGLLVFQNLTNFLLNSAAPATQTTGILGTGTYALWVNGAGTATMSLGSATGCGTGAASQGTVVTFTITVAGTCTVTVAGSLNAFQLDNTNFGGPLCPTSGATQACAADVVTVTNPVVFGNSYTSFGKGTPQATNSTGNQILVAIDAGSNNNRLLLYRSAGGAHSFNSSAGTGVDINAGTWNQGTLGRFANSSAQGAQAASFNGGAVGTTSGNLPIGVNAVRIGSDVTTANFFNGVISEVAVFANTAQPAAKLQAFGSR